MVAGKVKSAMGLQKPKTEPAAKPHPPSHKANSGGRSFGVYFPRSSAQVQPRPPDVTELLRIIEELGEREALLRNELVEQKLVRESAAIVPVLENEIQIRDLEIDKFRRKIECLEDENQRVRNENEFLHMELSKQNHKYEEKIKYMQSELLEIKREVTEQEAATAAANLKLVDVTNSYKSNFAGGRCLRKCQTQSNIVAGNFPDQSAPVKKEEFNATVESCTERPKLSSPEPSDSLIEIRSRAPRIPRPPPRPSSSPDSSDRAFAGISNVPPPPPPPPPPSSLKRAPPPPPPPPPPPSNSKTSAPPPPPPPPKGLKPKPAVAKVRRIPEVVEFYHSLMRRDCNFRRDSGGGGGADAASAGVTPKDMIGEIENRSSHLLAIKTDVETQGDFIRSLIKEVEGAAFSDIEDVVPFVKWLDDELSYLVDERAVLKHFQWPEQKADALREAAFGFVDLKKLESEVSLFRDDLRQPCTPALKKIQSLFEKLEHRVYNLSRMRESASKRYKLYRIPMDWMLDTGYVSQIKLASVKLAMKYMKRVSAELGSVGGGGPEEEELIVQGVKFAFRVHQFAGGFDMETMRAFKELRDKAEACQNHNKFNGRPSY